MTLQELPVGVSPFMVFGNRPLFPDGLTDHSDQVVADVVQQLQGPFPAAAVPVGLCDVVGNGINRVMPRRCQHIPRRRPPWACTRQPPYAVRGLAT